MMFDYVYYNCSIDNIFKYIGILASIFTIINFLSWVYGISKNKEKKPLNKEKKPLNEEEKSFYLGPFCWIILLWYRYKAFKGNGDQKIAKYYLKYVYLIKLYSRDARKQSLAIKEMVQLPDIRWTFLELVKRVGRKPRLSSDNKFLLIDEIRELSKRMGNSNIRG